MPKFGHTPYTEKQNVELAIASLTINIVFKINYKFVGPQNGLTSLEHMKQGFHFLLGKLLSIFIHLSTLVIGNHFPI
jgi:hypothetical protein